MEFRAELAIANAVGLHARPAANLVREAKKFPAAIVLEKGGRRADAKSIFQVLALGVRQGDHITLTVSGDQAEEAFRQIAGFIESGLGE